ncbi:MAG: SCO6880 family protein, partial [Candidatus Limnocylindria bacterium]
PQVGALVIAAFAALGALRAGGLGGLGFAAVILGAMGGGVLVPVRGQTLEQWAPLSVRFLLGRFSGAARFRSQRAQLGHLVLLPDGQLDPQPAAAPQATPGELAEVELLEVTLSRYEDARLGVAVDRGAHSYTATVRVSGRAFALLGPEDREARLEEYGAVLAALARDDSPVRRVAWIERTLPADA